MSDEMKLQKHIDELAGDMTLATMILCGCSPPENIPTKWPLSVLAAMHMDRVKALEKEVCELRARALKADKGQ